MGQKLPDNIVKVSAEKRILNEFISKALNEERKDIVVESREDSHVSDHAEMVFHCECDDAGCNETISLSPEEYTRMHRKATQFMVVPGHVSLDLEDVVASFSTFILVAKSGLVA